MNLIAFTFKIFVLFTLFAVLLDQAYAKADENKLWAFQILQRFS